MTNSKKKISYLSVSAIEGDPELPRKYFNEEKLKEISDSIKEKGVLQPLVVREKKNKPGRYSVVMGKRRLKGALLTGYSEIPCIIEDIDDKEALELALTENIQRDDLTPFEEAWGIVKLMKDYGYSTEEVAKKIGKGYRFINMRLQLLSLPEEIQKCVVVGKLGIAEAASLVSLNTSKQLEVAKEITSSSLSREQVKEMVLRKVEDQRGKWIRNKEKAKLRKIKLMARNLTELLKTLNCDDLPYSERHDVESALLELKKGIGQAIAKNKQS